ncbi:MAG: hypothetical protein M1818_004562 [Claussenomyces sp. TS43310]|nr:MAG: hypothetical protein M1818_004562 [Claussenomyces sp. TS43310]
MAYSTIEPRLIALLNDKASVSAHPRIDLPPLQNSTVVKASQRPSPLEPDASKRNAKHDAIPPQQTVTFDRDLPSNATPPTPLDSKDVSTERALGDDSPHALRKILDDPETAAATPTRKRHRIETSKEEFVQLPEPPKKHRTVNQAVPPIIIGLFEPPPNAALFPPISSSSFHDSHGRNSLNLVPQGTNQEDVVNRIHPKLVGSQDQLGKKIQKPAVRPRKKWSEEETKDLLLGVQKHGIGNWTRILHDSAFTFNGRKAVDLKDRFRTCCPTELQKREKGTFADADSSEGATVEMKARPKSSLLFENILVSSSDDSDVEEKPESCSSAMARKSRAHRKKLEDLVELGIKGPFKESRRRERKPFSEEEDRNILQGFQEFGPLWTTIQKDPRFSLESRRPTDLRDRLRNKYPQRYFAEEDSKKLSKESVIAVRAEPPSKQYLVSHLTDSSSSHDRLSKHTSHPGIDERITSKSTSLPLPMYNSFSDFLGPPANIEVSDSLSFPQSLEWAETLAPFTNTIGDMEISRLLLDDSCWNPTFTNSSIKQKPSYTDISSICTSTTSAGFTTLYNTTGLESHQLFSPPVSSHREARQN